MANYTVEWKIEVEADNPLDAARQALEIQRDKNSIATCFEVFDNDGYFVDVFDLDLEMNTKETENG